MIGMRVESGVWEQWNELGNEGGSQVHSLGQASQESKPMQTDGLALLRWLTEQGDTAVLSVTDVLLPPDDHPDDNHIFAVSPGLPVTWLSQTDPTSSCRPGIHKAMLPRVI